MLNVKRVALVCAIALTALAQGVAGQIPTGSDASNTITIFFVRHGEADPSDDRIPLDSRGFERAFRLVRVLERVQLTHAFSSHTLRSRQAVRPAAESQGLVVIPLPPLGSELGGYLINDVSPSNLAIVPLTDALRTLPPGSTALVGVNSDNLFGILNGLGVPLGTDNEPCELGRVCVPCLDNSCFPPEFDNLWLLVLSDGRPRTLQWLKY